MIGNALLACAGLLAVATLIFVIQSVRSTRQRYYDEYIARKRRDR